MFQEQKPKSSNLATAQLILAAIIVFTVCLCVVLGVAGYLGRNKPAKERAVDVPVDIVEKSASVIIKDLTEEDVKNAEYNSVYWKNEVIKLKDGVYDKESSESSSIGHIGIFDDKISWGDLNHDYIADAAIIFDSSFGDSEHFYELAVVLNESGNPVHIASMALSDSIAIKYFSIIDTETIRVEMVVKNPDNGTGCPTGRKTVDYIFSDNMLAEKKGDYGNVEADERDAWETYINEEYSFKLKYPEDLINSPPLKAYSIQRTTSDGKKYSGFSLGQFNNGCNLSFFITDINKDIDPFNETGFSEKAKEVVATEDLEVNDKSYHFGIFVSSHAVKTEKCKTFFDKIISTLEFTEKEKEITKDKTENWQNYTNEKYGFELFFPKSWKGVKRALSNSAGVETILFELPTSDKNWEYGSGFSSIFSLNIESKEDWLKAHLEKDLNSQYIYNNNKYVFDFDIIGNRPEDLLEVDVSDIISTFHLIDKVSFGSLSAYVKKEIAYNYVILSEGGKETIVDKGSTTYDEGVDGDWGPMWFGGPSFSPKGNYLLYGAGMHESGASFVYDIQSKKNVLTVFDDSSGIGFTSNEKYFYACSWAGMGSDALGFIYSVPDFKVVFNALCSLDSPGGASCRYDPKTDSIIYFDELSAFNDVKTDIIRYSLKEQKEYVLYKEANDEDSVQGE